MKAAVYARLSRKKDEAELGVNIEDQRAIGEQLLKHRGWEHVGTFTDDGKGAFKDDAERPAFREMLAARPDVIVARDAERIGRGRPEDTVALIRSKARVVMWLDGDTAEPDRDARLINPDSYEFAIKSAAAREYSRKVSVNVRSKIRVKAAKGALPHGGIRAFGYERDGTIRADEAAVIRDVAARWLDGESLSALCRDLDARGVKTPAGKPWQYARLRRMLTGPRIAGIRAHNGVEVEGQWEPIIDRDLHRRLVTAAAGSVKRASANGAYILTGLVECACGTVMYGFRQHRRKDAPVQTRYVCREGCGRGIDATRADEWVLNRSFLAILAPELRNRKQTQRDIARLRATVADLEGRLEELDDAYWRERTITKDRWAKQSSALGTDLDNVRTSLAEAKRRLAEDRDVPETAEELATRWRDGDARERNRLLRTAVECVVIHPADGGKGRFDGSRIEVRLRNGQVDRVAPGEIVPERFLESVAANG